MQDKESMGNAEIARYGGTPGKEFFPESGGVGVTQ